MACSVTECNECGYKSYNTFLDYCPKCGSKNVDREHDPEYDFGGPFEGEEDADD